MLDDDQLAVFNRDPSGTLTFNTVFTNGSDGVSGLGNSGGIAGVSVSPDGQQVFAVSFHNDSLAVFDRDTSGTLTFKEAFTTNIQSPTSVAVSADNQHVFVANYNGNPDLVVLDRDPSSGTLTVNNSFSDVTGISQPTFVVVSPDGKQVFLAGRSGGIGVFDRDASGNVTFKEFFTDSTLTVVETLGISPDGAQVFAKDTISASLVVFDRDVASGTLTFRERFQDGQGGVEGLRGSFDDIEVSPDGSYVFVTGKNDNSVAVFDRDTSGNLTFNTVFTDGQSGIESLGQASGLSLSPDGTQLFVTSVGDNTLSVFDIAPPAVNLSLSAVSGTEADATVITVTATADSAVSSDQTVDVTVAGAGITSDDYALSNASITIPAGQTTGTVTFTVADDRVDEGDSETVTLTLSNPSSGLTLGITTTQTVTLADNDVAGFTLGQTAVSVSETGPSTAIEVTLTSQPTSNVVLNITNSDPSEVTAEPLTLTFTPANWTTSQSITLNGADDSDIDGDQTSTITVSVVDTDSDDAFDALDDQLITVTTTDNDTASAPSVTPTPSVTLTPSVTPSTPPNNPLSPPPLSPSEPSTLTPTGNLGIPQPDIRFKKQTDQVSVEGTAENEVLRGTPQADYMVGGAGNDKLFAGIKSDGFGQDQLFGNGGNDKLWGGKGKDYLDGGSGNDKLRGGKNRDTLIGGDGRDRLLGQHGNDILTGGEGNDVLIGGSGRDTFIYESLDDGTDTIKRFQLAKDLIDLSAIFADAAFSGDTDFLRFSQFVELAEVNGSTEVRVDIDGNGTNTEMLTLAVVKRVTGLSSENFSIG